MKKEKQRKERANQQRERTPKARITRKASIENDNKKRKKLS